VVVMMEPHENSDIPDLMDSSSPNLEYKVADLKVHGGSCD
jgi:hypothetical protein